MTTEIAILNREAVALASDSAVTASMGENRQKIFTSANKIFRLSLYRPVGIMIFGNAGLLNVPWDTIIKIYRKKLDKNKFDTIKEYTNHFIEYLENESSLFPLSEQDNNFKMYLRLYFMEIFDQFDSIVEDRVSISNSEKKSIISDIITEHYNEWDNAKIIPSLSEGYLRKIANKFRKSINKVIKEIFKDCWLSKYQHDQLTKIALSLTTKIYPSGVSNTGVSGIVIAGFGEKDIFPSVETISIEGMVENKLIYFNSSSHKIDYKQGATIVPFAQQDMITTFMEGIAPECKRFHKRFISKLLEAYPELVIAKLEKYNDTEKRELMEKLRKANQEIMKDLNNELNKFIRREYVNPVIDIVRMLPKDELALMAETLVSLTSFKRRVSNQVETVGGPVDVAVISKGDGFVWIKRKHYFKPELNPQFFKNYYMEVENGKKQNSEI